MQIIHSSNLIYSILIQTKHSGTYIQGGESRDLKIGKIQKTICDKENTSFNPFKPNGLGYLYL